MTNPIEQDLRQIETREWHLWVLALGLILVMGSVTAATYFYFLADGLEGLGLHRQAVDRALAGLCVLLGLFCAYVIHTRSAFTRMRRLLEKQAMRDALTGLYNRQYFNYRLAEEISRADRGRHPLALLVCDLDHFKAVNDTKGHQAGDRVLEAVARAIQEATRGSDLVFRWGGDEFVVVLSESSYSGILIAGERIREGVRRIAGEMYPALDLSIGVAVYPEHGSTIDELMRMADRALYVAKRGDYRIHIGAGELGLDESTVKVVFQPIMDARSGRTVGYEAFSRDPKNQLNILELFKKYNAVGQLNELKRLCFLSQMKAAQKAGLDRVFLNVDFTLLGVLEPVAKPAGMEVILEISELEVLNDVEKHLAIARSWRKQGYKFAIDDFGAGFVSLPFIAQLVPEFIKMDRSTILQAVASEKFRGFLKDMIQALENYTSEGIIAEGIETVAEGVETEKEMQVVKEMGVYLVQGFSLGKPQEL